MNKIALTWIGGIAGHKLNRAAQSVGCARDQRGVAVEELRDIHICELSVVMEEIILVWSDGELHQRHSIHAFNVTVCFQ